MCVLFYLGQLSHFPSCFGAGVTNLNEPPSSFLLPPHYCGLGAGCIPFRAIVNNKQCEMRGLFMLLVIHYWIGDVQDCQGVSASEMTYIVSGGALNSTHSLTAACSNIIPTDVLQILHCHIVVGLTYFVCYCLRICAECLWLSNRKVIWPLNVPL